MTHEEQVQKMTGQMAKFVGYIGKKLPDDVIAKLSELRGQETSPLASTLYDTMFKNQELAVKLDRPSCQDTGVLQFWVKCGTGFPLIDDLEALLKEAVVEATVAGQPCVYPIRLGELKSNYKYKVSLTLKHIGGDPSNPWKKVEFTNLRASITVVDWTSGTPVSETI